MEPKDCRYANGECCGISDISRGMLEAWTSHWWRQMDKSASWRILIFFPVTHPTFCTKYFPLPTGRSSSTISRSKNFFRHWFLKYIPIHPELPKEDLSFQDIYAEIRQLLYFSVYSRNKYMGSHQLIQIVSPCWTGHKKKDRQNFGGKQNKPFQSLTANSTICSTK